MFLPYLTFLAHPSLFRIGPSYSFTVLTPDPEGSKNTSRHRLISAPFSLPHRFEANYNMSLTLPAIVRRWITRSSI